MLAFGGHSGLSRVVDILEPIVFRDVGGDSMSLFISAKKQAGYRGKIWADDMNSSSECCATGRLQKIASAAPYTAPL